MRKQKINASVNSSIEHRPELFDFYANRDKNVSLILKNENVKNGKLLCICQDDVIILDIKTPVGVTYISETPLFDVSEILVLDN